MVQENHITSVLFKWKINNTFVGWNSWLIASCALESVDDVQASVEAMAPGPGCDLLLVLLGDVAALLRGLRGCSWGALNIFQANRSVIPIAASVVSERSFWRMNMKYINGSCTEDWNKHYKRVKDGFVSAKL
jgi:hypothetical protein